MIVLSVNICYRFHKCGGLQHSFSVMIYTVQDIHRITSQYKTCKAACLPVSCMNNGTPFDLIHRYCILYLDCTLCLIMKLTAFSFQHVLCQCGTISVIISHTLRFRLVYFSRLCHIPSKQIAKRQEDQFVKFYVLWFEGRFTIPGC